MTRYPNSGKLAREEHAQVPLQRSWLFFFETDGPMCLATEFRKSRKSSPRLICPGKAFDE